MEKSKKSINMEGGNVRGGWIIFFKISKHDFTFIREMRVLSQRLISLQQPFLILLAEIYLKSPNNLNEPCTFLSE